MKRLTLLGSVLAVILPALAWASAKAVMILIGSLGLSLGPLGPKMLQALIGLAGLAAFHFFDFDPWLILLIGA